MAYLRLITPPASEPVTLDEAKNHLRIDITDDDALITTLIVAARRMAEAYTKRSFINTVWEAGLDYFPVAGGYFDRTIRQMGPSPLWYLKQAGIFRLPRPPIISISSVVYYDTTYQVQTLDPSKYRLVDDKLSPAPGTVWPVAPMMDAAVKVTYSAGYGADASSVPDSIKAAIKLMVGHWYEHREAASEVPNLAELPIGIESLLRAEHSGVYY